MKEFVEKLIGRLEERKDNVPVNRLLDDIIKDKPKELGQLMAYDDAIEIVNQLAEEYKPYINNNDLMIVESLPSLYPMKEFEEEAIQRVIGCAKKEYNNGWIPCSERLPIGKEYRIELEDAIYYKHMLTTTNDSDIPMYIGWYDQENEQWYDIEGFPYHPIAWQQLPALYQKGE